MSEARNKAQVGPWLFLGLMLLVGPGLLVATVFQLDNRPDAISPGAKPVVVPIDKASFSDDVSVDLKLSWVDGESLQAPMWNGIVTELGLQPGESATTGTRIARVDGTWRIAVASARPFFAAVDASSQPDEVRLFNDTLRQLGYSSSPGSSWGARTVSGLQTLAKDLGVPAVKDVSAFDPSWVLWLPREEFVVASVGVTVGADVTEAESILTGPKLLAAASVQPREGAAEGLPNPGDGVWVVRAGATEVPFSGSDVIDAQGALQETYRGTAPELVEASVVRTDVVEAWGMPSGALYADPTGDACVFIPSGSSYKSVIVKSVAGEVGRIQVVGDLSVTEQVLMNPARILDNPSCE